MISFLDDDVLGSIGEQAQCLRMLDCSGCIDISDAGKLTSTNAELNQQLLL